MRITIAHEAQRQIEFLTTPETASASGSAEPPLSVLQETRGFDENTFTTFRLRSKEDAPDYRYMPDANLGVVCISEVYFSPSLAMVFTPLESRRPFAYVPLTLFLI